MEVLFDNRRYKAMANLDGTALTALAKTLTFRNFLSFLPLRLRKTFFKKQKQTLFDRLKMPKQWICHNE